MADVTVTVEAYSEGLLPDICAVSGRPTTAHMRQLAEIHYRSPLDRIVAFLENLLAQAPRHPRVTVVRGFIPIHPDVERSLTRRRRAALAWTWIGLLALVAVAWSAASWAPFAAIALIAGTGGGIWFLARVRRRMPAATLDTTRALVHLSRVHPDFAAAAVEPG